MYVGYLRKHVRPFVGHLKAGVLDADTLDSLYAELRRCQIHCDGRARIDHRTPREHECDERCQVHVCRPLSTSTIRQIHFVLSGAYKGVLLGVEVVVALDALPVGAVVVGLGGPPEGPASSSPLVRLFTLRRESVWFAGCQQWGLRWWM